MTWPLMIVLVLGAYGFKALGVTAVGVAAARRLSTLVALMPAALFAGLVTVMTVEQQGGLVLDARLVGVAAGSAAAWRRVPFILVVAVAMAATAVTRALA